MYGMVRINADAWPSGNWWLRSPNYNNTNFCNVNNGSANNNNASYSYGVFPAILVW